MISGLKPLLAAGSMFLLSHADAATVYRCPQADGSVSFQQTACQAGTRLEVEAPAVGWKGQRPAAKARSKTGAGQGPVSGRPAGIQGSRTDWQGGGESKACWGRRQQLEKTRVKLRRGYKPVEGERLRRQRDEHEDYLRRFC